MLLSVLFYFTTCAGIMFLCRNDDTHDIIVISTIYLLTELRRQYWWYGRISLRIAVINTVNCGLSLIICLWLRDLTTVVEDIGQITGIPVENMFHLITVANGGGNSESEVDNTTEKFMVRRKADGGNLRNVVHIVRLVIIWITKMALDYYVADKKPKANCKSTRKVIKDLSVKEHGTFTNKVKKDSAVVCDEDTANGNVNENACEGMSCESDNSVEVLTTPKSSGGLLEHKRRGKKMSSIWKHTSGPRVQLLEPDGCPFEDNFSSPVLPSGRVLTARSPKGQGRFETSRVFQGHRGSPVFSPNNLTVGERVKLNRRKLQHPSVVRTLFRSPRRAKKVFFGKHVLQSVTEEPTVTINP